LNVGSEFKKHSPQTPLRIQIYLFIFFFRGCQDRHCDEEAARSPHKVAGGRTVTVLRGDLKANSRGMNKSVQSIVKSARRKCIVEQWEFVD
jgi:hypothetical protein